MMVGDIVEYIDDWKKGREWFLYDLYSDNFCKIVLVRDGKFTNKKNGENRLNASIVNLSIKKIKLIK
jgi:hypothetical protein